MRSRFLIIIISFVTISGIYATDVSGNITSNTTWSASNSPYNVTGDVGVPSGYTLTIEPDVTVNYLGDYKILVKGNIIINGTVQSHVIFNGNSSTGSEIMILFKSTDLSNSSINYTDYTGPQYALQLSEESEHNQDEINRKEIRIGDTVLIQRAGDVIPQVLEVEKNKRNKNVKFFFFPSTCPSCGSKVVKDYNKTTKKIEAVTRCPDINFDCKEILKEKLKHFASKDAFNIEGLGKKVIQNFWDIKMIKFPADIFSLNFEKIKDLDGWGKLSASNLEKAINKSKNIVVIWFFRFTANKHRIFAGCCLLQEENDDNRPIDAKY